MPKSFSKVLILIMLSGAVAIITATILSFELSAEVIYVKGREVTDHRGTGVECSGKGDNCKIRIGAGKAILLKYD